MKQLYLVQNDVLNQKLWEHVTPSTLIGLFSVVDKKIDPLHMAVHTAKLVLVANTVVGECSKVEEGRLDYFIATPET